MIGGYEAPIPNGFIGPDPVTLAAAGIALGLDESEFLEFETRFSSPYPPNLSPQYFYRLMIEVAYDIKMKRKGD